MKASMRAMIGLVGSWLMILLCLLFSFGNLFFGLWLMWEAATKRHDYKEGDVDAPFYNTYGSGSWYIHSVGEYLTNYIAPSFAAAGHTLALKDGSMEESLPIFSIAGIIFILCSMANLVSAIAFKHAMDRDTTSPVTLAGSNATSTDKHISALKLVREFAVTALLYAIAAALVICLWFTLYNYLVSAAWAEKYSGVKQVWLSGQWNSMPQLYGCVFNVLMPEAFDGQFDQGPNPYRVDTTLLEYQAWGFENGCQARANSALPGNDLYTFYLTDDSASQNYGIGPITGPNGNAVYADLWAPPTGLDGKVYASVHQTKPLPAIFNDREADVPHGIYTCLGVFMDAMSQWAQLGAAPVLIYLCVFPAFPATSIVIVPLLSTLWCAIFAVDFVVERAGFHGFDPSSYTNMAEFYNRYTVYNQNMQAVNADYFSHDTAGTCLLGCCAFLGVLVEALWNKNNHYFISAFSALVIPFFLLLQAWLWKDYIYQGDPRYGLLWFKLAQVPKMIYIRFLLVFGLSFVLVYLGKKVMELLPMSNLRYALPMFFFSFWGIMGRVAQSSIPNVGINIAIELFLVGFEIIQVWAFMHTMGPTKYMLLFFFKRHQLKEAYDGSEYSTATFRTAADIPPKIYAYNYIICVHAVCEAAMVLIGGLTPLLLNLQLSPTDCPTGATTQQCNIWLKEFPQRVVLANTFISLMCETLIADSIFCFLAARQQRKAHSFLATWRTRSSRSLGVFVLSCCLASLPLFRGAAATAQIAISENMFGFRYFPKPLNCYDALRRLECMTWDGKVVPYPYKAPCQLANSSFYVEIVGSGYPSDNFCGGFIV